MWTGVYFAEDRIVRDADGVDSPAPPSGPEKKDFDPDDVVDTKTTLTIRESKDFSKWIESQPEIRNRYMADQIALFRDFQKSMAGSPAHCTDATRLGGYSPRGPFVDDVELKSEGSLSDPQVTTDLEPVQGVEV